MATWRLGPKPFRTPESILKPESGRRNFGAAASGMAVWPRANGTKASPAAGCGEEQRQQAAAVHGRGDVRWSRFAQSPAAGWVASGNVTRRIGKHGTARLIVTEVGVSGRAAAAPNVWRSRKLHGRVWSSRTSNHRQRNISFPLAEHARSAEARMPWTTPFRISPWSQPNGAATTPTNVIPLPLSTLLADSARDDRPHQAAAVHGGLKRVEFGRL